MIVRLQTTASTMKDAAELAAQGAPHGTVVVAESQTNGIGRHGHSWHSAPDGGIYMSIILRMPVVGPEITLAMGLAVQAALSEVAATDLRWPNDVMLNGRKVAGILVQSAGQCAIVGIGINVGQESFPVELRQVATSLRIETGLQLSIDLVMERVLAEALQYSQLPKAEILRLFTASSTYAQGKPVEVEGRFTGITDGLDPDGFLLVRTSTVVRTVTAGGVRATSGYC